MTSAELVTRMREHFRVARQNSVCSAHGSRPGRGQGRVPASGVIELL